METKGFSDELLRKETEAIVSLGKASSIQNQFWREKVKESWLLDADFGSRFFHNYAKTSRNRSSISMLEINEEVTTDQSIIADHICSFYRNLYSDHSTFGLGSLDTDLIIPGLVTVLDN